jgi:hypothetical protein
MADLLAYSNHHDLTHRIGALLTDISERPTKRPGLQAHHRSWNLPNRLLSEDADEFADLFRAGTPKTRGLAAKFGISLKSVKRGLLRQLGIGR